MTPALAAILDYFATHPAPVSAGGVAAAHGDAAAGARGAGRLQWILRIGRANAPGSPSAADLASIQLKVDNMPLFTNTTVDLQH